MDIGNIPEELNKRINNAIDSFLKAHKTGETGRINIECVKKSRDLQVKFNMINKYILWASTKEGHYFYYFLNLRWAIFLSYIIHEFNNKYDYYCLGKIDEYFDYVSYPFDDADTYKTKGYTRMYKHFSEKIKKIGTIFGN